MWKVVSGRAAWDRQGELERDPGGCILAPQGWDGGGAPGQPMILLDGTLPASLRLALNADERGLSALPGLVGVGALASEPRRAAAPVTLGLISKP